MLLRCHIGSWYSLSLHLAFLCFSDLIVFNILCGNTESLRFFWCGCFALVLHCIWIVLPFVNFLKFSDLSFWIFSLSLMKLWLVINICNSIPFHVFHLFVSLPHAGQWLKNFPSDQLVFFSPVCTVPLIYPFEFLILILPFSFLQVLFDKFVIL